MVVQISNGIVVPFECLIGIELYGEEDTGSRQTGTKRLTPVLQSTFVDKEKQRKLLLSNIKRRIYFTSGAYKQKHK